MDRKQAPGRPPKLSLAQKRKLVDILLERPLAFGYSTNLWTTRRVAEVIQQSFGIRYHPDHIWRVLVGLRWSCQKPERRARERDEDAIERWKKRRWPAIKKTLTLGAHLAFLDESGFMLIPLLWRTWTPRGQTLLVRHVYRRDRLSAISALTISPQRRHWGLYFSLQARNIKGGDVVTFLRFLLGHLRGPMVPVWDEVLTHKGRPIQDFLAKHPSGFMQSGFPNMLPNSILRSMFGLRPSTGWRIVRPRG